MVQFPVKPCSVAEAKIQEWISANVQPRQLESVHMLSDRSALVCLTDGSSFVLRYTRHAMIRTYINDEI